MMMDTKEIFKEFNSLEDIVNEANTCNVVSLPGLVHKLGMSKERFPMFFVATNKTQSIIPNIVRELLTVEYDVTCTVKETNGTSLQGNFTILTLRTQDENLQFYFIEICLMILEKITFQPSKQELFIEIERIVTIFSALNSTPRKKIQGLWAELMVIERSKNPFVLVKAWHSLVSSKYDFTLGRDKIEVKSTSSEERVHRFSLDQLNPSPSSRLLIASMIVRESGKCNQGLSIRNLYDKICSRLQCIDTKIKLYTVIAQTLGKDLSKIESVYYDYITASDSLNYYDYQVIPRILKEYVPVGITDVKFCCDMTDLENIEKSNSILEINNSELFVSL